MLTRVGDSALEGSTLQVSEQGLRKVLYQKIVAAFPEGWMSSGQISREGKFRGNFLNSMLTVACSEHNEEAAGEGGDGGGE